MKFEDQKRKIIKWFRKNCMVFDFNTFRTFSHIFGNDLDLEGQEILVVSNFPRFNAFTVSVTNYISIPGIESTSKHAMELLRYGIGKIIVYPVRDASWGDNIAKVLDPTIILHPDDLLVQMNAGNPINLIEKILNERRSRPKAKRVG